MHESSRSFYKSGIPHVKINKIRRLFSHKILFRKHIQGVNIIISIILFFFTNIQNDLFNLIFVFKNLIFQ